jgi:hypothetical protein
MAIAQELVAPITEDLRAEDLKFDIVKGIEHVNYVDGKWVPGAATAVEEGDWVTKTNSGYDVIAAGNGVANVYPVVEGNNRYDAIATGNVTVIEAGGFKYKTKKFVPGAYTVGMNLTVKDLGAGEMVPSAAGASDAIVARVMSYDAAKGVMDILVLNR